MYSGAFAIAWNAFVGFWTVGAFTGGGILFALFSLPFWAAGAMLGKCVPYPIPSQERHIP